jgi:hypothetical protein
VDGQPADAAEVVVFSDELSILSQNLDAMIVAIGDDQPVFRIELEWVRRSELAQSRSRLTNRSEKLSVLVEDRNSSDEIGVGSSRTQTMATCTRVKRITSTRLAS